MTEAEIKASRGSLSTGHATSFALGWKSITLTASNYTFPESGRTEIPIELFSAGGGSVTLKGLTGDWITRVLPANGTISCAFTEIAGNGTTTATGIQVAY